MAAYTLYFSDEPVFTSLQEGIDHSGGVIFLGEGGEKPSSTWGIEPLKSENFETSKEGKYIEARIDKDDYKKPPRWIVEENNDRHYPFKNYVRIKTIPDQERIEGGYVEQIFGGNDALVVGAFSVGYNRTAGYRDKLGWIDSIWLLEEETALKVTVQQKSKIVSYVIFLEDDTPKILPLEYWEALEVREEADLENDEVLFQSLTPAEAHKPMLDNGLNLIDHIFMRDSAIGNIIVFGNYREEFKPTIVPCIGFEKDHTFDPVSVRKTPTGKLYITLADKQISPTGSLLVYKPYSSNPCNEVSAIKGNPEQLIKAFEGHSERSSSSDLWVVNKGDVLGGSSPFSAIIVYGERGLFRTQLLDWEKEEFERNPDFFLEQNRARPGSIPEEWIGSIVKVTVSVRPQYRPVLGLVESVNPLRVITNWRDAKPSGSLTIEKYEWVELQPLRATRDQIHILIAQRQKLKQNTFSFIESVEKILNEDCSRYLPYADRESLHTLMDEIEIIQETGPTASLENALERGKQIVDDIKDLIPAAENILQLVNDGKLIHRCGGFEGPLGQKNSVEYFAIDENGAYVSMKQNFIDGMVFAYFTGSAEVAVAKVEITSEGEEEFSYIHEPKNVSPSQLSAVQSKKNSAFKDIRRQLETVA